jgi:hypothetical protein
MAPSEAASSGWRKVSPAPPARPKTARAASSKVGNDAAIARALIAVSA